MLAGDQDFAEVLQEAPWVVGGKEGKGYSIKRAERAFLMD